MLEDILEHNVRRNRDRAALFYDGRRLSYPELLDRIRCLSATLGDVARPGDRVAIYAENSAEYVECYYGVPMAGMGVGLRQLPPGPPRGCPHPGRRRAHRDHHGAQLSRCCDRLPPSAAIVRAVVVIGGAGSPGTLSYEALLSAAPEGDGSPAVSEDDLAWLIYTSGTTGMPKGAMLSHRNLISAVCNAGFAATPDPDVVTLFPWPLCHVAGYSILISHTTGATVVLMRSYDLEGWFGRIQEHRVTAASIAPTMLNILLDHSHFDDCDLSSLRTIGYGATAMPVEVLRRAMDRLLGVEFATGFGMTELAGNVMSLSTEAHGQPVAGENSVLRSVGRELPLSSVRIVDDAMNDVEGDAIGDLVVRGDQVMRGYWRNEEGTEAAFGGPWFHTGDLARWDLAGNLYIVDRKKDMIITGGENVYSREVEEVLYQHPAVAEAAVIGLPDQNWGENVVACVQIRADTAVSEYELIGHCRDHLAGFKKPRRVVFFEEFPRNAAGQLLEQELR